ncbi:NUDIX hydrolase [Hoyosella rhizosphaerae]|uniref:Hydrolase MutT/NUDIX n=1 Tax=Hoyosella rhizosphaerae TaxID=1755582 RepID=A0A916X8Z6_9ACTN|nr:putative hydrolase MutT/NUDIX [Hoyosella rhizosphaerae]
MGSTKKKKHKSTSVLAAGAVLWRRTPKGVREIAVVHRPRYDDWSLPKGKLDSGETPVIAAAREIEEETGFVPKLGRHLIRVSYPLKDAKRKEVDYWAAEALGGEFVPNEECDELLWLTVEKAAKKVSYNLDRRVIKIYAKQPTDVTTLLFVRHAKAGRREDFFGDDTARPLIPEGRAQAEALLPHFLAFGATDVHSADRVRCTQTVAPLADELNRDIIVEPTLSEEAYIKDPEAAHKRLLEISRLPGTRVVCSQGKVIPHITEWLAQRSGITLPPSDNLKGSVWVLSLLDGRLLSADYLASPHSDTALSTA